MFLGFVWSNMGIGRGRVEFGMLRSREEARIGMELPEKSNKYILKKYMKAHL